MSGVLEAVWERHQHGYMVVLVLLFALSVGLLKQRGWFLMGVFFLGLAVCLEVGYRAMRVRAKVNHKSWWGKPRKSIPRAYGVLAGALVVLLVESQIARYWLIATIVGSGIVAAGLYLHRRFEGQHMDLEVK